MLKVKVPKNNIDERIYILDIILIEFLGLNYEVFFLEEDFTYWEIELPNANKLFFSDCFFNKFLIELEYLKIYNLPDRILFQKKIKNEYLVENNIPILFGKNSFKEKINNNQKEIFCGIDIFASSFFMLTRWEEYVNKNRDEHGRFSAKDSIAFKYDFLDRPIVNEYVTMLKNMFLKMGLEEKVKNRKYNILLTHDVDVPLKFRGLKNDLKEVIIDLIKRKNLKLGISNIISKIKTILKLQKDPFDTFDFLMDISERINVKSHFFFMGEGLTKYDNLYKSDDSFILKLKEKIKKRDHHIGIHPSYNAYNSTEQFKKEKNELEKNFDMPLFFGREHYLRFEIPKTWQIWEDNNMKWDSSLSFADKEGFRCGVCYEFSVFNILTRKKLKLKEKPLIVMEASFITYQPNIHPIEMKKKINDLIFRVKKYDGEFVLLWHNNNFNSPGWKLYKNIYEEVLLPKFKKENYL